MVLKIIKRELTLEKACRSNGLRQSEIEGWMDELIKSGTRGLKTPSRDSQDEQTREINEMKAKIGELVLELDARKKLQALIDLEENDC
ncbi:MAG: hypothetical protein CVV49_02650 [Spirochaetae bacterium HGW-Spirochaetae-5]|nr:MAG: hypothetical protein CVV49_02650 [Spirochaetae bacterium HGW-Spirochaetae-5]